MLQILRTNSFGELRNGPSWFYSCLARHLSIPVELGTKKGTRFGMVWRHEGEFYGSMLRQDNRVAFGLINHVRRLADHYGVQYSYRDLREAPEQQYPWWSVKMPWRPYQDRVHKALLANATGVVHCSPRGGKTAMAARILDVLAQPTVYLAPSVQIVRQTYERFCEYWGEDNVARLDGSASRHEKDPSRAVVVATPPSALAQPQEWWDGREVLVVDEAHHSAAETYHKINERAASIYHRYFLTGTHFRSGDDGLAMDAVLGEVIAHVPVGELVPKYLATPRVVFLDTPPSAVKGKEWQTIYRSGIVDAGPRNDAVVQIANTMLENSIPTIVLTRRRKHADELADRIRGAVAVKGGENELTSGVVRDFTEGLFDCLVGTTVIGEGVDVPRATALVYASGGRGGVAMAQSYYRPLTAFEGKHVGRIYDFKDTHHSMLRKQARSRWKMATSMFGACVLGDR